MKQPKSKKKAIVGIASASIIALSSFFATPITDILAAKEVPNHGTVVSMSKHGAKTSTPIKHVVVIFGENVSFDHYFGTYPNAKNYPGESMFKASPKTPSVNGLTNEFLSKNPNGANPQRLSPAEALTPSMNHGYTAEQQAFDGGKMDKFVHYTGRDNPLVMNYYDGNTVTGLWNYAQNFALSDNSFDTTFGPSTPGALNLVSGQTHGAKVYSNDVEKETVSGNVVNGSVIGDPDPYFDKYSNHKGTTSSLSGKNVGDLLNNKGVTWGWFQGGFLNPNATHKNISGKDVRDYSPHHEPFQYYKSTANPDHLAPSSIDKIGYTDHANHQYDLEDFWKSADNGNLPAVSFLKAAAYQDAHPGNSDPLDEQQFIVDTINKLQKLPEWKDTAVVLAYDDSDGWYDHVASPSVNGSNDPSTDALNTQGVEGKPRLGNYLDRAGYGPRLPLLVVSPYAKKNYVDHTLTDQSSILRFIEDNWSLGQIGDYSYDSVAGSLNNMFNFKQNGHKKKLFLNPTTGQPVKKEDNNQNDHN
jgi:phospholipase C